MNKIIRQDWFKSLVDEIKSTLTESVFVSRWALIEGYHHIGHLILRECGERQISFKELCNTVAKELQKSERTLYYAVEFVEKYPKLDMLPEGKNISWHKICNNLLVSGEKKDKPIVCKKCPLHCENNQNKK